MYETFFRFLEDTSQILNNMFSENKMMQVTDVVSDINKVVM